MSALFLLVILLLVGIVIVGTVAVGVVQTQLWIRKLGASKRQVRDHARAWLAMQGKPSVRLLLRALHHEEARVRREVAMVLGDIDDHRVIVPLLDALDDAEKTVQWEAISALGRLRATAGVDRLIALLNGTDKEARRRSAEALGFIGGQRVLNALEYALHDSDAGVRKHVVAALADEGNFDRRHVALLVEALQDPQAEIRVLAAETLKAYEWQPQNDRERVVWEIARQHWDAPLLAHPAAVQPLLRMLNDERPENAHARINAAVALGKIGAPQAFEPLVRMGRHIEANLRRTAVEALGDLQDERALAVLIHTINDTAATVRAASATALGRFENPDSIEALIKALGDTDPARLGDRNPDVQRAAAAALAHMPGDRVTITLVNALEDDDAVVREEAAHVLQQRGWTPQQDDDAIREAVARQAWDTVRQFGAQALPFLIDRSADKARPVREAATSLLTTLLASVKIALFGDLRVKEDRKRVTFQNPRIEALTLPMEHLEHLVIHVPTYDFHCLEQFLTYAVNYVGQQHLKRRVTAHVYGNSGDVHPNLLNSLRNLCKAVEEHS